MPTLTIAAKAIQRHLAALGPLQQPSTIIKPVSFFQIHSGCTSLCSAAISVYEANQFTVD